MMIPAKLKEFVRRKYLIAQDISLNNYFVSKLLHLNVPSVFMIESVVACNLACPECPLGSGMVSRDKGVLSYDDFTLIADKIRPYVKFLYLIIWGEPLLNKDIIKIIKYASEFTRVSISTNGILITYDLAEQLITSGLHELILSIDAVTQDVYQQYRIGGNIDKVLESLKMLQELNAKNGNKVIIIPQFIVFKHNKHEMGLFAHICESLHLKPSFKSPYFSDNTLLEVSDLPQYVRTAYSDSTELFKLMSKCQDPRKVFTILLDGTVVACCYDYNGITNFGNIFQQDVLEIWNSPKYNSFRLNTLNGNISEFCQKSCLQYRKAEPDDKSSIGKL